MFSRNVAYELPITREYISHWGLLDGVREIVQNALDSDSPFEWNIEEDTLYIHSRYSTLEPKTLLLGCTSKAEATDKIGSFGEGYKLAMLCLHRAGYGVRLRNNGVAWTPEFRFNTKFGSDILYIVENRLDFKQKGLTFEISGLTETDIVEIRQSCLAMQ